MIDVKEFVQEIAGILNKPFDIPFKAQLTSSAIGYRATILKQEFDKNGRYPLGSEDSLVLSLIQVKPVECCCSETLDCYVARTRDLVPSAIRGNFKPEPFLFVGSSDMSAEYMYAQPHEVERILTGTKFLQNEVIYSYFNRFIYVFNNEGNRLGVRDVFSNAKELLETKNCDGHPCIDTIYIEDDMRRIIKQMILEEFRGTRVIEEKEVKINESN